MTNLWSSRSKRNCPGRLLNQPISRSPLGASPCSRAKAISTSSHWFSLQKEVLLWSRCNISTLSGKNRSMSTPPCQTSSDKCLSMRPQTRQLIWSVDSSSLSPRRESRHNRPCPTPSLKRLTKLRPRARSRRNARDPRAPARRVQRLIQAALRVRNRPRSRAAMPFQRPNWLRNVAEASRVKAHRLRNLQLQKTVVSKTWVHLLSEERNLTVSKLLTVYRPRSQRHLQTVVKILPHSVSSAKNCDSIAKQCQIGKRGDMVVLSDRLTDKQMERRINGRHYLRLPYQ